MSRDIRDCSGRHQPIQLQISRGLYAQIFEWSENYFMTNPAQDMTDVFERCQRKEAQRLQTFKDTLFQIHKCLNISEDPA